MRGMLYGLGFGILLLATCTLPAQDKGKKAAGPQNLPTPEQTSILRQAGQVDALLLRVGGTNRFLTVNVPYPRSGPPDKKGRSRMTTAWQKLDLELTEEPQVRFLQPRIKFDDKGKPIPYTKEELAELRGSDPKVPGYAADASDLREGQTLRLFFTRPKTTSEGEPPAEGKLQVGIVLIVAEGLTPQRPNDNKKK